MPEEEALYWRVECLSQGHMEYGYDLACGTHDHAHKSDDNSANKDKYQEVQFDDTRDAMVSHTSTVAGELIGGGV